MDLLMVSPQCMWGDEETRTSGFGSLIGSIINIQSFRDIISYRIYRRGYDRRHLSL